MRPDILAIIDTDRLRHNLAAIRSLCGPDVRICAALKADAYGHGMDIVAPALQDAGVDYAAVATLHEAVRLRGLGWRQPILVLGHVLSIPDEDERVDRLAAICRHDLTVSVADRPTVELLRSPSGSKPIAVHVKIDTGMGRMGLMPDSAPEVVGAIRDASHLRISGVYSHFAAADMAASDTARGQLGRFKAILDEIADLLPAGVIRHMANSAALMGLPESRLDMVRPGLALYGYPPARHLGGDMGLMPILRLVSYLASVKDVPSGHGVGYGETHTTVRPTRLGIVPIGYFDGYVRALSNISVVSTASGDAPVIGRISMDQLAIDLTDLPGVGPGAEIVLIDDDSGRPNSVVGLADRLETIPYEVTCLLGPRIGRVSADRIHRPRAELRTDN